MYAVAPSCTCATACARPSRCTIAFRYGHRYRPNHHDPDRCAERTRNPLRCTTSNMLLILVFSFFAVTEAVTQHPILLIVSFDGFRPDYVRPDVTPHMARFRDTGAAPPYMRPVFSTKTFVNHFSMATGLYAETHGILDNNMFDKNGNPMSYTYEQFHYDDSVVPIWTLNENTGGGRYSGVMMWTGGEYPYQGKTATYAQKFNESMPWTKRVDTFMSWIMDEKKPANLVMAYFEEPDHTAHTNGIDSQNTKNQIVRADVTLKYILDRIKEADLEDKVNVIIVSDHGMETIKYEGIIFLDKYVSNVTSKVIVSGPNAFVLPNPGKFDEVYTNLSIGASTTGNFHVYKQEQIPDRWHLKNSPLLTDILYVLTEPGHVFWADYFAGILNKTTKDKFRIGQHGYDTEDPNMHATFMASGPLFKKNFTAPPFDNIDLYPLIVRIMGLMEPPTNVRPNGTITIVEHLLSDNSGGGTVIPSLPVVQGASLAALLLITFTRRL